MLLVTDGRGAYWASLGKTGQQTYRLDLELTTNHGQHTERKTTWLA